MWLKRGMVTKVRRWHKGMQLFFVTIFARAAMQSFG
jgi:hypothetical protein